MQQHKCGALAAESKPIYCTDSGHFSEHYMTTKMEIYMRLSVCYLHGGDDHATVHDKLAKSC